MDDFHSLFFLLYDRALRMWSSEGIWKRRSSSGGMNAFFLKKRNEPSQDVSENIFLKKTLHKQGAILCGSRNQERRDKI